MDGNFSKRFMFDLQRFTDYTLNQDGSTYKLSGGSGGDKTATKLSDLFTSSNVTSSDTVTVNSTITISANDTIDFQGATINGSQTSGAVFQVKSGTVTMTNGTVKSSNDGTAPLQVDSGAIVTLTGEGTATDDQITGTDDKSAYDALFTKNLILDGTTTKEGTTPSKASMVNGVILNGTLNVNGGARIYSNYGSTIFYNNAANAAMNVNGGWIESSGTEMPISFGGNGISFEMTSGKIFFNEPSSSGVCVQYRCPGFLIQKLTLIHALLMRQITPSR